MADALAQLFRHGSLASVTVSYWRGKKGSAWLVPPEAIEPLRKAETRARDALRKHALPFPLGTSHFVPSRRMDAFLVAVRDAKRAFRIAERGFRARYADDVAAALADDSTARADDYPDVGELEFRLAAQPYRVLPDDAWDAGDVRATVDVFLEDAVLAVRARVLESCASTAARLADGRAVTARQASALRTAVSDAEDLNVAGDLRLADAIRGLRDALPPPNGSLAAGRDDAARSRLWDALRPVVGVAESEDGVDEVVAAWWDRGALAAAPTGA